MKSWLTSRVAGLRSSESGAALVEFTLLAPFLLVLALGMSEFGRFLYQYQLVIEGLRDGARYLARLDPDSTTNQTNAANLATTGTIDGTGDPRVDGWLAADVTFSVTNVDNSAGTYRGLSIVKVVVATTTFDYADVGFLGALGLPALSVVATHQQRAITE
jgi:Flp pilus assembly protein TadG